MNLWKEALLLSYSIFPIPPVLGDGVKRFFHKSEAVREASCPQSAKKFSIRILSFI